MVAAIARGASGRQHARSPRPRRADRHPLPLRSVRSADADGRRPLCLERPRLQPRRQNDLPLDPFRRCARFGHGISMSRAVRSPTAACMSTPMACPGGPTVVRSTPMAATGPPPLTGGSLCASPGGRGRSPYRASSFQAEHAGLRRRTARHDLCHLDQAGQCRSVQPAACRQPVRSRRCRHRGSPGTALCRVGSRQ